MLISLLLFFVFIVIYLSLKDSNKTIEKPKIEPLASSNVKYVNYTTLQVHRYGYANFINDLFDNKKFKVDLDYYEEDYYGFDDYIYKYNFDKVPATLKQSENDIYEVLIKNSKGIETIGYVYANDFAKEIISHNHSAMVSTYGGKRKKVIYNDDGDFVRFGEEQFEDYDFILELTQKD